MRDAASKGTRWVRNGVLWAGDLVIVGAFVAGNAAYFVQPEHLWGFQLAAIAAPYVGVAVFVAAAWAAWARRWRLAASHITLIFFALLIPMTASGPGGGEAAPNAPPLKVMTFNVPPERASAQGEALDTVIAGERPHFVALQEFPVQLTRSKGWTGGSVLVGALLQGGAYRVSWPAGDEEHVKLALPVFTRLEEAGSAEVLVEGGGLWESGGVLRARYRWQGRTISVYNVHLHSFSEKRPWRRVDGKRRLFSIAAWVEAMRAFRSDFQIRAEQARWLRQTLDAEPYPFLVCGDLNSTPRNWVYAHLSEGLTDAAREAGRGWGGTFPALLPLFRIDYVLASEAWEVRSSRVEDAVASDHLPVIVALALRYDSADGAPEKLSPR